MGEPMSRCAKGRAVTIIGMARAFALSGALLVAAHSLDPSAASVGAESTEHRSDTQATWDHQQTEPRLVGGYVGRFCVRDTTYLELSATGRYVLVAFECHGNLYTVEAGEFRSRGPHKIEFQRKCGGGAWAGPYFPYLFVEYSASQSPYLLDPGRPDKDGLTLVGHEARSIIREEVSNVMRLDPEWEKRLRPDSEIGRAFLGIAATGGRQ